MTSDQLASNTPRVLVIDDDREWLDLVSAQMLTHWGLVPIILDNPSRAREVVAEPLFRPDLVIVDLYMPDIDGLTLIEQLTATYPGLPVVAVSSRIDDELAIQARLVGAVGTRDKRELLGELHELAGHLV